jgi:hypothetical protein
VPWLGRNQDQTGLLSVKTYQERADLAYYCEPASLRKDVKDDELVQPQERNDHEHARIYCRRVFVHDKRALPRSGGSDSRQCRCLSSAEVVLLGPILDMVLGSIWLPLSMLGDSIYLLARVLVQTGSIDHEVGHSLVPWEPMRTRTLEWEMNR